MGTLGYRNSSTLCSEIIILDNDPPLPAGLACAELVLATYLSVQLWSDPWVLPPLSLIPGSWSQGRTACWKHRETSVQLSIATQFKTDQLCCWHGIGAQHGQSHAEAWRVFVWTSEGSQTAWAHMRVLIFPQNPNDPNNNNNNNSRHLCNAIRAYKVLSHN